MGYFLSIFLHFFQSQSNISAIELSSFSQTGEHPPHTRSQTLLCSLWVGDTKQQFLLLQEEHHSDAQHLQSSPERIGDTTYSLTC